jgi:hypothetical protein
LPEVGYNLRVVLTTTSARLAVIALAVLAIILMVVAVRAEAHAATGARMIRSFAGACAVLAAVVALIPER